MNQPILQFVIAAAQTGIAFAFEFLPNAISVYFLEQTDNQIWVAAYGLGQMLCRAYGLGFLNALGCGLETLVSQAYGAGQFGFCGILYNKNLFLITLLIIPISLILYLSTEALALINKYLLNIYKYKKQLGVKSININICNFDDYICISEWNLCKYKSVFKWLKYLSVLISNNNSYQFYTQAMSCVVCFLLNYTLISKYGIIGCAISATLTELCNNLILFTFIQKSQCCTKTINKNIFDFKQLQKNGIYLWISLKIGAILWFEWICFDFYTVQVSYLDNEMIAVNFLLFSVGGFFYSFSYGIGIAATTLVGNEMGRNSIVKAKYYTFMSLILLTIYLVISLVILWITRNSIIQFMTNNVGVQNILLDIYPIFLVQVISDCKLIQQMKQIELQAVLSGLIRSIGQEQISLVSFLFSYLIFGQLVAYICCFHLNWKLTGIWMGILSGSVK